MVDLSRRGLVQALTAAAGLLTTPGAAAAKAAMSIADAPGFGVVAALTGHGPNPQSPAPHPSYDYSPATRAAMRVLERRAYETKVRTVPRASIECFRSASRVNKSRWEEEALDADADMHVKYRQVLEWLHNGTIKL